jgi:tetratricopeptide (TPR) repeat protein
LASDFALTDLTQAAVSRICRLVVGLPLGIELAATWVRYLPVTQIADSIETNLDFLTVTMRDLPARHRSLRTVFEHTWQRLSEEEQIFFCRLALFRGGFDLAAATAIVDERPTGRELQVLAALTDKCLLRHQGENGAAPRFTMLETVRAYALEQLERRGDAPDTHRRHAVYYLSLAAEAAPHVKGEDQAIWLARLGGEHNNFRAALTWLREQGEFETAAQLCEYLWFFWYVRGHYAEARQHIEPLLAQAIPDSLRANLLHATGTLALAQADSKAAQRYLEESITLKEAVGDLAGIARTLNNLGNVAYHQNDYERAILLYEHSLALKRQFGQKMDIAYALNNLGSLAYSGGDLTRAESYFEESLALFRKVNVSQGMALALMNLGLMALRQGQIERARHLSEEGIALRRELGDVSGLAQALYNLAAVERSRGNLPQAETLCLECLALFEQVQDSFGIMMGLCGVAFVAAAAEEMVRAAHLLGAVEAIGAAIAAEPPTSELKEIERVRREAQQQLGTEPLEAAWSNGRLLSLETAAAYARQHLIA